MKYKELQSLKPAERKKKEQELIIELIKLQSQVATGTTLKSPGQIRQLKRTLARLQSLKQEQTTEEEEKHA